MEKGSAELCLGTLVWKKSNEDFGLWSTLAFRVIFPNIMCRVLSVRCSRETTFPPAYRVGVPHDTKICGSMCRPTWSPTILTGHGDAEWRMSHGSESVMSSFDRWQNSQPHIFCFSFSLALFLFDWFIPCHHLLFKEAVNSSSQSILCPRQPCFLRILLLLKKKQKQTSRRTRIGVRLSEIRVDAIMTNKPTTRN